MTDSSLVIAGRRFASPEKRIELAYRLVMSRRPQEKERAVLLAGLERLKQQLSAELAPSGLALPG